MYQSKFKKGEIVLYQNGNIFELGIIKTVVNAGSQEEGKIAYNYRVWYHTGDTTALTHESDLHKITNAYAFNIIRRSANDEIDMNPCRQLAANILTDVPVYEENYYELEDWLTKIFNEGKIDSMPQIKLTVSNLNDKQRMKCVQLLGEELSDEELIDGLINEVHRN
jgi:hypothetical protein